VPGAPLRQSGEPGGWLLSMVEGASPRRISQEINKGRPAGTVPPICSIRVRELWLKSSSVDRDELAQRVARGPGIVAAAAVAVGAVGHGVLGRAAFSAAIPGAALVAKAVIRQVVGLDAGAAASGEMADIGRLRAEPYKCLAPRSGCNKLNY
jgi:hypothetical protein